MFDSEGTAAFLTAWTGLAPPVLAALAAVYGILLAASLALVAGLAFGRFKLGGELDLRIRSWWVMILIATAALAAGTVGVILLFAFVSYLALQEYVSIIPSRVEDRPVILLAYVAAVFSYGLIYFGRYGIFLVFIPVYAFLIFPFVMTWTGAVRRFLSTVGTLHWGLVTTVYNLGYVACLMNLPEEGNPAAGGAGLVVFLLFATEANDVAQYLWGKMIGGPRILPTVSPNKTWAGFLGGVATATALAFFLAPLLTPFSGGMALFIGAVIALAGFAGDVTISAVKRDLGLKDTSFIIPGHGGILDRMDSLMFTAPLFFHILYFFYY